MYAPMAGSLTRQNWIYQQHLIDISGDTFDGLGDVGSLATKTVEIPVYPVLVSILAGFTARRVGVLPLAAVSALAYGYLSSMKK